MNFMAYGFIKNKDAIELEKEISDIFLDKFIARSKNEYISSKKNFLIWINFNLKNKRRVIEIKQYKYKKNIYIKEKEEYIYIENKNIILERIKLLNKEIKLKEVFMNERRGSVYE
jgi:hypothetical protein